MHLLPNAVKRVAWIDGVDALVAPGCRWDSTWYLEIASGGYSPTEPARSAFFPLYPALVGVVSAPLGGALVPAGLLVSWTSAVAFLATLHRVVARARDVATAGTVVRVAAYVPPAGRLGRVVRQLDLGGVAGVRGASCARQRVVSVICWSAPMRPASSRRSRARGRCWRRTEPSYAPRRSTTSGTWSDGFSPLR